MPKRDIRKIFWTCFATVFFRVCLFSVKRRKTIYVNNGLKKTLGIFGSVAVGGISGFFGGGGGMVAVPLLKLVGADTKRAHATALLVILPICIISAAIYIRNGYFEPSAVVCACIGVVLGGIVGAYLLDKLNPEVVAVIFSLLMIAVGIKSVIP